MTRASDTRPRELLFRRASTAAAVVRERAFWQVNRDTVEAFSGHHLRAVCPLVEISTSGVPRSCCKHTHTYTHLARGSSRGILSSSRRRSSPRPAAPRWRVHQNVQPGAVACDRGRSISNRVSIECDRLAVSRESVHVELIAWLSRDPLSAERDNERLDDIEGNRESFSLI